MAKRYFLSSWLLVGLFLGSGAWTAAQNDPAQIRVNVNLVQLNVAVTDNKGNYVTGLRPQDFIVTEDRIPEKIATFEEGLEPARNVTDANPSAGEVEADKTGLAENQASPQAAVSRYSDASLFILFDTSNYMYR